MPVRLALITWKVIVGGRMTEHYPDFRLDDPDKAVAVKLAKPRATFEQKGLTAAGAIDSDPVTSGWAVDPQFGKDHAAVFETSFRWLHAGSRFVYSLPHRRSCRAG